MVFDTFLGAVSGVSELLVPRIVVVSIVVLPFVLVFVPQGSACWTSEGFSIFLDGLSTHSITMNARETSSIRRYSVD